MIDHIEKRLRDKKKLIDIRNEANLILNELGIKDFQVADYLIESDLRRLGVEIIKITPYDKKNLESARKLMDMYSYTKLTENSYYTSRVEGIFIIFLDEKVEIPIDITSVNNFINHDRYISLILSQVLEHLFVEKKANSSIGSKFYLYIQNNSGGEFIYNEKIAPYIAIEANSAEEANKLAEGIGIYFDGTKKGQDCKCCGNRWERSNDEELDKITNDPVVWPVNRKFSSIIDLKKYIDRKGEHLRKWVIFNNKPILYLPTTTKESPDFSHGECQIYYSNGHKEEY